MSAAKARKAVVVTGRVFIVYPRGVRTGGPELLHQFCHALRMRGIDAVLVPTRKSRGRDRVPEYAQYDCPEVNAVEDSPVNSVVFSEYLPGRMMRRVRRARRYHWWMSVDNSPAFRWTMRRSNARLEATAGVSSTGAWRPWFVMLTIEKMRRLEIRLRSNDVHLSQSQYAASVVSNFLGREAKMLSDFLRKSEPAAESLVARRQKVICVNGSKGLQLLDLVRPELVNAGWTVKVLKGMSSEQVRDSLAESTVYLDLGHHPGRDRLPREAARAGAVVVVANRGSAAFHEDVPIDKCFKVELSEGFVGDLLAVLERVECDPSAALEMQAEYRSWISADWKRFDHEVDSFVHMDRR